MNDENIKNDALSHKELFFEKTLGKLREKPVKMNENKALVLKYYTEIRELLEKGLTLKEIAEEIASSTDMSEATFKKNYHLIKNDQKVKGKSKELTRNKRPVDAVINDFVNTCKDDEKNSKDENVTLLNDEI